MAATSSLFPFFLFFFFFFLPDFIFKKKEIFCSSPPINSSFTPTPRRSSQQQKNQRWRREGRKRVRSKTVWESKRESEMPTTYCCRGVPLLVYLINPQTAHVESEPLCSSHTLAVCCWLPEPPVPPPSFPLQGCNCEGKKREHVEYGAGDRFHMLDY